MKEVDNFGEVSLESKVGYNDGWMVVEGEPWLGGVMELSEEEIEDLGEGINSAWFVWNGLGEGGLLILNWFNLFSFGTWM